MGFGSDGWCYGTAAGTCSTALIREGLKQLEAHLRSSGANSVTNARDLS
jgi:hypothetical protein